MTNSIYSTSSNAIISEQRNMAKASANIANNNISNTTAKTNEVKELTDLNTSKQAIQADAKVISTQNKCIDSLIDILA